jgi:myo-inositol 2-dehydrogenase / D-chiro-inositol 1-dehydrogenase
MAHGHDICTEMIGTKGMVIVNLVPRRDSEMVADEGGIRYEV